MKTGTPRRTLLQQGLALLAGGVAVATGSGIARAEAAPLPAPVAPDPVPSATTLTFYTRKRPSAVPEANGRAAHAHHARSGELLDAPDGTAVGSLIANCFCASGAAPSTGASDLEVQVLQLQEGTLFAMCGGPADRHGARTHAILGGTGRYAGARGVCVEQPAANTAVRNIHQLIVTLAG
jgi:hypothetical protein